MGQIVTAITTAAQSYDLVSLETAKDDLGIPPADTSSDLFLRRAIAMASAAVNSYCDRPFVVETVQDTFYLDFGRAQAILLLSRYPVVSFTSLTSIDSTGTATPMTQGTDFVADPKSGRVLNIQGIESVGEEDGDESGIPNPYFLVQALPYTTFWGPGTVVAVYQAGYAVIPWDIQDAVLRLVRIRYFSRTRDPMMVEKGGGQNGTERYWVGTPGSLKCGLPEDIAGMLDSYRLTAALN